MPSKGITTKGASPATDVAEGRFFLYGDRELDYLRSKDKRLAWAIDEIGHIDRSVNPDLFHSLVDSIIGQQISTAAHKTLRERLASLTDQVTAESIVGLGRDGLQSIGMTYKKADYIMSLSDKVLSGELDLEGLNELSDEEVIAVLSELDGVGKWTAEMMMTFSMQRPDVVSYGDLAILRGMRMLYRHRKIDKAKFERYRKRYSPYGTVASLYLWAIAGGAIDGLTDPAPKAPSKKKGKR